MSRARYLSYYIIGLFILPFCIVESRAANLGVQQVDTIVEIASSQAQIAKVDSLLSVFDLLLQTEQNDSIENVEATDSVGYVLDSATEPIIGLAVATPKKSMLKPVIRKQKGVTAPEMNQKVRVGNDTVSIVIPQKNYGRFDRGLFNYLFIPKGKWAFGLTASYGEFNTEDVQVLSMLKDVDFKGKLYSINPSISYFFNHNQSIGLRVNYTRGTGDLGSLVLDFDEDMNFSLKDISYYTHNYSVGVAYRNYVGLSNMRRFAVFNEVSLDFGSGSSRFKRYYNEELFDTYTRTTSASLNFSPGVCVFIQEFAAFNVSFGVFGVKMKNEKQSTNGVDDGSRFSSGANFKFNIFNINFGLLVVI